MRPFREVDLRFALQTAEGVEAVYALDDTLAKQSPETYKYLASVRPYQQRVIMAAHYRVVDATDGERLPLVLFFDAEHPPPLLARAHRVVLTVEERDAAVLRSCERSIVSILQTAVVPEPDLFATIYVSLTPPNARCSAEASACKASRTPDCGRRGFPMYPHAWFSQCSEQTGRGG
jgi:hypothetical protein